MTRTSVDAELELLESGLDAEFALLPSSLRAALDRVPLTLGGRFAAAGRWSARFSPLTLLYPWMQAQAVGRTGLSPVLPFCVAHVLSVLQCFLEDRHRDRQVLLDEEQLELCDVLKSRALELFSEAATDEGWLAEQVAEASRDRTWALEQTYPSDDTDEARDQAARIAAGHSSPGRIAALVLLREMGAETALCESARTLYDRLMVGLQWADDLEDWDEDLVSGDRNLILTQLPAFSSSAVTAEGADHVALDLLRSGVLETAISRSRESLREVAEQQRCLGCGLLAASVLDVVAGVGAFDRSLVYARQELLLNVLGLEEAAGGLG